MTDKTLIVVEGKEDEDFLDPYIKFLGYSDETFNILQTKGKGKLEKDGIRNEIENALDRDSKVLIIFDADLDYEGTKTGIKDRLKGLTGFEIFLFPDDSITGAVEDLLEKIINSEYKRIFECFEKYKQCISKFMNEYEYKYKLPDKKAKIYAYKQVLDIRKDPFEPRYWDFESTALEPLKSFLEQNL